MKLFIVSVDDFGWDEYDSHVISAETKKEAIKLAGFYQDKIDVKEIGVSKYKTSCIVHSSFNAG